VHRGQELAETEFELKETEGKQRKREDHRSENFVVVVALLLLLLARVCTAGGVMKPQL
tara:strand:- start:389 stop:562 length:174 start_codon:yes stop_codon:yes gene_type:complete